MIESPYLDKFSLQPKATARRPQISSLSTSPDCIFSFQQIPTQLSFRAKANLYIQHLSNCFPLKQTFYYKNKKQSKKQTKLSFLFKFKSNSKAIQKSKIFNVQKGISKVFRPKSKSNLTKAPFLFFQKAFFLFPPLLIKISFLI